MLMVMMLWWINKQILICCAHTKEGGLITAMIRTKGGWGYHLQSRKQPPEDAEPCYVLHLRPVLNNRNIVVDRVETNWQVPSGPAACLAHLLGEPLVGKRNMPFLDLVYDPRIHGYKTYIAATDVVWVCITYQMCWIHRVRLTGILVQVGIERLFQLWIRSTTRPRDELSW